MAVGHLRENALLALKFTHVAVIKWLSLVGAGYYLPPQNSNSAAKNCFVTGLINRGYYMPARGDEFYLRVVNSISHA